MQQSAVREICRITEVRSAGVVQAHYRYGSYGKTVTHTAERTKWGMRTIYDGLSFEAVKEGETTPDSRSITTTGTNGASINEYKLDGSHTRGTRYLLYSG